MSPTKRWLMIGVIWVGELKGAADPSLKTVAVDKVTTNPVVVDMRRVLRVDFVCGGAIANAFTGSWRRPSTFGCWKPHHSGAAAAHRCASQPVCEDGLVNWPGPASFSYCRLAAGFHGFQTRFSRHHHCLRCAAAIPSPLAAMAR